MEKVFQLNKFQLFSAAASLKLMLSGVSLLLRVNYESYFVIDSFPSRQCSSKKNVYTWTENVDEKSFIQSLKLALSSWILKEMENRIGSQLNIESVKMNWFVHKRRCVFRRSWQYKKPVCQPYHFDIKINKFTTTPLPPSWWHSESSTGKARFS